jgi:hypothetical protein
MKKLSSLVLVGVAIVFAAVSPGYAAAEHGGHAFSGHSAGGHFEGHRGFEGHHGFDGRRGRGGAIIGVPFGLAPDYSDSYWYYCPSYGAYYPAVPSCPEEWVPVPG